MTLGSESDVVEVIDVGSNEDVVCLGRKKSRKLERGAVAVTNKATNKDEVVQRVVSMAFF